MILMNQMKNKFMHAKKYKSFVTQTRKKGYGVFLKTIFPISTKNTAGKEPIYTYKSNT